MQLSEGALQELQKNQWSGNIRELQNAVERLAVLSSENQIDKDDVQTIISNKKKN